MTDLLIDLQNAQSTHLIYLDQVGIRDIKHPALLQTKNSTQPIIATFNMAVGLAADKRGTHMSRFVEVLNQREWILSVDHMQELLAVTAEKFKSDSVMINAKFTMFINKTAPVSKASSLVDYDIELTGNFSTNKNQTHNNTVSIKVIVPVTTLCPCSKEISDYGAHNQRSHITLQITPTSPMNIEDLIKLVEQEASCEIYSILKRADEKYVTERAYNNPRFVEDIVRNIAYKLNTHPTIKFSYYKIESENFESIHNHSAYAMLESGTSHQ